MFAFANINKTKHNLSVTGPGTIKAGTETRICVFCHTPHNGTPETPLWNHDISGQSYSLYTSSTLPLLPGKPGGPAQPTGPTKLCLSCHDGTVALGSLVNTLPTGPELQFPLPSNSLSNFKTDLSSHHPVVFSYSQAQKADPEELVDVNSLPPELTLGGAAGDVHCTTCHDPHDNTYGDFLVMDNRFSVLCTACHQMKDWVGSGHATSSSPVEGILPRAPKTFPSWAQVNEWGCEVCHTPHLAATPQELLNFCSSPCPAPYTSSFDCTTAGCHSSTPQPYHPSSYAASSAKVRVSAIPNGTVDIKRQTMKLSAHREQPGNRMLSLQGSKRSASTAVGAGCIDCHNPHASKKQTASAPNASGMLKGVGGIDVNGMEVQSVRYEYEICFKCHGDYNSDIPIVRRVVNTLNTRLAFAETNPSYHPIASIGKGRNVPSIPSSYEPLLNSTDFIYCTDCHRDDQGGSRGPHGSSYSPILRERYETADNTPESYDNYALCYRCHNRTSILRDDSFKKNSMGKGGHSGHLAERAPCSACHDPHGVNDAAQSGNHTHLINFDMTIVLPKPGNTYPIFTDNGTFSGSCTLICHGRLHDNESYPQSGPSAAGRFFPRRGRPLR